ncbi:hypothetical protein [Nocardia sp. R7R-8]|uniref:hypothetical protein n=1 Tax=Nocardia sp. R7R-8 TaxID=3459304 RepID=UPI00403D7BC3
MPTRVTPGGPIFGPDALSPGRGLADDRTAPLLVYPDVSNVGLRLAGQPTRYYVQPGRATIAPRSDTAELDFSMTSFVRHIPPRGTSDYAGGTAKFTTTTALPTSAQESIVEAIMSAAHDDLPGRIRPLFPYTNGDPTPELLTIPIVHTVAFCAIRKSEVERDPRGFSVQTDTAGSIEGQVRATFLASCGPVEAQEFEASLTTGIALPLIAGATLTEQFAIADSTLTIDLDIDTHGLHNAFADIASKEPAITAHAATAVIFQSIADGNTIRVEAARMGLEPLDPRTRQWVSQCEEVKSAVIEVVKDFFDVHPEPPGSAPPNDPPWWKLIFGTATPTLRSKPDMQLPRIHHTVPISGQVSADHTVECGFDELAAAAKVDSAAYLTRIDIGPG